MLFVDNSVIQFCQFSLIPTLGCSNKVTCNTLQLINILAATFRAYFQLRLSILIAAIHTAITIVIHRAITDIVLIH